jgi:hypothetical protein
MNDTVNFIKNEIFRIIKEHSPDLFNPDWNRWYIGLTIYPNQKKNEKGKPEIWSSWKAKNAGEAKEIKKWFTDNFPINSSDTEGDFDYFVYIFKI